MLPPAGQTDKPPNPIEENVERAVPTSSLGDKNAHDLILDVGATANSSPSQSSSEGKDGPLKDRSFDPASEDHQPGIGNFWRILSYGTTLDRYLMIVGAICSAGAGVTLPLMNIVFGHLVNDFNGYFVPNTTVTRAQFTHSVNQNALDITYLFIAKFFLDYVSIFCFRMSGIRISASVRLAYLKALFAQPVSAIDRMPPGMATDSLTTVANTIQAGISDKLAILVQAAGLVISAYAVAFTYSWALTLVATSAIVAMILFYGIVITPVLIRQDNAVTQSNSRASAVAGEVLTAVRTVKSLCAENAMIERYAKWVSEARVRGIKMSPAQAGSLSPVFFCIYANMALTFWFGVRLYSEGHVKNVSNVVIVLFSVLGTVSAIGNLVVPLQNINKAAVASEMCFKAIDATKIDRTGLKFPEVQASSDIAFENVKFSYPSRPGTAILKGLTLGIPAGKITALVGPSGSGKSTIVGLLERWYRLSDLNYSLPTKNDDDKDSKTKTKTKDKKNKKVKKSSAEVDSEILESPMKQDEPILQNSGCIRLGEHNVDDLDLRWWRTQIGLVQQEPFLFNETIYGNVAMGLVGSELEDVSEDQKRELVKAACEEAFAAEFIDRLPLGYDTIVGESGIKLSGGQRQRLAIARSIVKRPKILILDEATSSIDVRGERIVQAALDRVSKGRTTVTIAHRLSTIKKADKIIVLKAGVAVEQGTHEDLVAVPDGLYAGLVRAQHLELGEEDADMVEGAEAAGDRAMLELTKSNFSLADSLNDKTDVSNVRTRGLFRSVGLFLYEQRQYSLIGLLIITGAMGAGSVFVVQSFLFSKIIVVFQLTGSRLLNRGDFWALMFFVVALAALLFYSMIGFFANTLSVLISNAYRQEYFESILGKPVSWFDGEDKSSGTLTARLSNDPKQLQEILGTSMAMPLMSIFSIIGSIILSFYFGWKLSLVTVFSAMPIIIVFSFARIRYEVQFESYNAKVFAESSQFAAESIGAFRTVTSLTLEDTIISRYDGLLKEHVKKAFKRGRLAVLVFALADSLNLACNALTFYYGGQLLASREYNVSQFFVIYTAVVQGAQAAGTFLAFGPNIAYATAAANRILNYRGEPEVRYDTDVQNRIDQALGEKGGQSGVEIEFKDVSFRYPTRDMLVYRNLNFKMGRGSYVAFVGPSGCGKTTIISLLERFYTPATGSIFIDGVPLSSLSLSTYRSSIALVSQEPTLFAGTIRENLILGLPSTVSDDEVEDACRAAEIHDFIVSLPESYGTTMAGGTHSSLSGGQKQRLCIARALLRRPRLLLLDEATSSLDSQSERLVQRAIDRVASSGAVTIVLVAHRLATVQNAGRIVVLGDGGKIVEEGNHKELVEKRGVYWGMCRAQALDR